MTTNIQELETRPAGSFFSQSAAIDAIANSKRNEENFSLQVREFSEDLLEKLITACYRSRCYLTYRKKFVAIKVEKPSTLDMISSEYEAFMKYVGEQSNCSVVKTQSALIVRVALG